MPPRRNTAEKPCYTYPSVFDDLESSWQREKRRKETQRAKSSKSARPKAGRKTTSTKRVNQKAVQDIDSEIDQLDSDDSDELTRQLLSLLEGDKDEEAAVRAKPRRVRASKGKSKSKKVIPARDLLAKLPEEVLQSIVNQLSLSALHSLACVSRKYRNKLHPAIVLELWQRAYGDIPELSEVSLEESGLTVAKVAELLYGRSCSKCGKKAGRWADWFLRRRLCKACRTDSLLPISRLGERPSLHSASGACVVQTLQARTNVQKMNGQPCASLKALSAESDLLWRFEEKDEDDEVEAFCPKANLQSSAMSSSDEEDDHRSHRRSVNSYYRWQPPRKAGDFGRRVKKYSEQRRAECQAVEELGSRLHSAVELLYAREDQEAARFEFDPSLGRRKTIEERVIATGRYEASLFTDKWRKAKIVNEGTSQVDDELWLKLEPEIAKLLESIAATLDEDKSHDEQAARRATLRGLYEAYRSSLAPKAAILTPLYADFALMPSARALWEPADAVLDDAAWTAARDGVEEDINEWRVSLRLYALQQIFQDFFEIADHVELAADADEYNDWGDPYFDSFLHSFVCSIQGCYVPGKSKDGGRPTFFGPLTVVLEHQHNMHADLAPSTALLKNPAAEPPFRIGLPLEFSVGLDALADIIADHRNDQIRLQSGRHAALIDPEELTVEDVDDYFEADCSRVLQWWNVPLSEEMAQRLRSKGHRDVERDDLGWWTKPGPKEREWRNVLCHIWRETAKARKAKEPYYLTVPMLSLSYD